VFYHYSRQANYGSICKPGSGLYASLPVVGTDSRPYLQGHFLVEALLDPYPQWLDRSPYYGDLGSELLDAYTGDLLLEISIPKNACQIYVADYAHILECKSLSRMGIAPLNLGYNCINGKEVVVADVNSYVEIGKYRGDHVAPVVKIVRKGEGIADKSEWIAIANDQPRRGMIATCRCNTRPSHIQMARHQ
jgi:hypothetical protein